MFGIFLLTAIILIFTSIYLYLRNRSKSAIANLQSRNIPIAEQPSFFSALWNKTRIELISQKNIQKIGKVYGWEMFGGINVTIAEPELIQLIMSKEFINFPNRRVRIVSLKQSHFSIFSFISNRNSIQMIQCFQTF